MVAGAKGVSPVGCDELAAVGEPVAVCSGGCSGALELERIDDMSADERRVAIKLMDWPYGGPAERDQQDDLPDCRVPVDAARWPRRLLLLPVCRPSGLQVPLVVIVVQVPEEQLDGR